MVRAHAAARPWRAAAVLADVVLAAWKLAAVYLLAVFATGLLWQLLSGSINRLMGIQSVVPGVVMCRRCAVGRGGLALTSGLDPSSLVWLGAGLAGLVLICVFALIRRWQQRGGRVRPLPDVGVALIAALGSAVGYLVALGRTLLRRQRGQLASA